MRPQTLSRFISGIFSALLFGGLVYRSSVKEFSMGKTAYLAEQARHFDEVVTLNAHNPITPIIGSLLVMGCLLGLYEFGAFLVAKMISPSSPAPETQQFGQGF